MEWIKKDRDTHRWFWRNWPLAAKLALTMMMMVVIVVMAVTLLFIHREQQSFQVELQQQAELLLDTLEVAVADPLYYLDVDALSDMIEALGKDRAIVVSGHIYDAEGRIVADAYDEDLTYSIEINSLGQRLIESETTVFEWQPTQLVAGRAVIVGHRRLGAISLGLPTAPLKAKLSSARNQGLGVGVAAALIGILLALLISRSITGPLQNLVRATKYIANGDLSRPIRVSGGDELATLGIAMERMRAELQNFYLDLEQLVAERTQTLQQSEERFRQVISSISDHIYMIELTERGKWVNQYLSPKIKALTGYPRENFMEDPAFWFSLIHPADKAIATAQVTDFTRGYDREVEYRLVRADGDIIWVRNSGRVEQHANRKNIVVYGVVSDITGRKRTEEALRTYRGHLELLVEARTIELTKANKQLRQEIAEHKQTEEALKRAKEAAEDANRAKSDFLANMSHELRTPLNHIIGFTELVVDQNVGELNAVQEEYLNDVLDSGKHLLALINDILDFAKMDASHSELEPTCIDLKKLLENSLILIKEKAMRHGIQLTTDLQELPETIVVDERKLKQVLYNLLSNAVKFTPEGGVIGLSACQVAGSELRVPGFAFQEPESSPSDFPDSGEGDHSQPATRSPQPGTENFVKISISDTGIGIEQEDLTRIFNPFEQVERSTSRSYHGTGVGLSLAKKLVELHDGQIWAESEGKGKGSTFTFVIPICQE